ncbi:MAG: hemerythrin domain-containing protein [Armatimonadota bacterium]|jgi:hemerythrin-like domain-containing protein
MLPIGPLMKEHRKIERMVALITDEAERLGAGGDEQEPDPEFIFDALLFMREYADECHHGKEEDILFAELQERDLSEEHREIMDRLLRDHERGRELSAALEDATNRWEDGDESARGEIVEALEGLADLYPDHIATEDDDFFIPVMDYFSDDEKEKMMEDMWDFDHELFTDLYEGCIVQYEGEGSGN